MSCPLARPTRELAVSSDHLSHFLPHLGRLPLQHRLPSNNAGSYSRHWPFGFAYIQWHLLLLLFNALLLSPCLSLCPFARVTLSTFESAWFTGIWEAEQRSREHGPLAAAFPGSAASLWTSRLCLRLELGRSGPCL